MIPIRLLTPAQYWAAVAAKHEEFRAHAGYGDGTCWSLNTAEYFAADAEDTYEGAAEAVRRYNKLAQRWAESRNPVYREALEAAAWPYQTAIYWIPPSAGQFFVSPVSPLPF